MRADRDGPISGAGGVEPIEVSALYHGSPSDLDVIEPRADHGDPRVKSAIFASPSRTFALAYSGGKWGDRDIEQSTRSGKHPKMLLREMRPGALQEVYDRPGHLYEVPEEGFEALPGRRTAKELVNYERVKPVGHERISNVLKALQADPSVDLHPYDPKHPDTVAAIRRQVKRVAEMTPDMASGYKKWRMEVAPSEIQELWARASESKK